MSDSILELSKRTITKIVKRLKLACCNCNWSLTNGDIHHILPKSKGGCDDHQNLTYLCPNCHRLAHQGFDIKMTSLRELIGDRWMEVYYPGTARFARHFGSPNAKIQRAEREKKRVEKVLKINDTIKKITESTIDFSKFGWVEKASKIIGITPQKVGGWMSRNMPEQYSKCFKKSLGQLGM